MAKPKAHGGPIESPMTGHPPVPGIASAPGIYTEHAALGPKGEDGGLPLKFYDTSLKPVMGAVDTTMHALVTPRGKK